MFSGETGISVSAKSTKFSVTFGHSWILRPNSQKKSRKWNKVGVSRSRIQCIILQQMEFSWPGSSITIPCTPKCSQLSKRGRNVQRTSTPEKTSCLEKPLPAQLRLSLRKLRVCSTFSWTYMSMMCSVISPWLCVFSSNSSTSYSHFVQ